MKDVKTRIMISTNTLKRESKKDIMVNNANYGLLKISRREHQVLNLISHEYSTKDIAEELYISEHTVQSHRKNLLKKLGAANTAGLIRKGFETQLLI